MRTIESVGSLFQLLEEVIHQHFIPALTGGDPCCKLERDLLPLPCQLGELESRSDVTSLFDTSVELLNTKGTINTFPMLDTTRLIAYEAPIIH